MTDSDPSDYPEAEISKLQGKVPVEALEDLVQEWHRTATLWDTARTDTFNARCETWESAADELEALITDHTNE